MKILLDECVTKKIKAHLQEFEVYTLNEMGWNGLKNGNLLKAAIKQQFDILLTIDKNLPYQQNTLQHEITIVVLDVKRSKIQNLVELIPKFKAQLKQFEKTRVYRISP
ncbi:MAG: hypothetical protein MUF71_02705 [Candidatus Kapabacteria bacterium]|jgi:predicted nuclease of predicted toxin-antitoxin system|nr:hypothetical protein [Candidatus Kapabacteria bacterium]